MGCYNDEILFIHIPKCAGWTVKNYMKDNLPGVVMPTDPDPENPMIQAMPMGHIRLQDIEAATGRHPSTWEKIVAVVRNPYERELSQALYWATRALKGHRHIHDKTTWKYVREWILREDVASAALESGKVFQWLPEHIDFTGWILDSDTQFHVWYEQHVIDPRKTRKGYSDFGGFYRYWLELDAVMPDNLHIIKQENIAEELPRVLFPERDNFDPPPPVPTMNKTNYVRATIAYYTPLAARIVDERYRYCFDQGWYKSWHEGKA